MNKQKRQKQEEKEIFNKFFCSYKGIEWFGQNKIIKIENSETPDFVFKTKDNKIIGLEIEKFILESSHQKYTQILTRTGNQIIQYIRKKYNLGISITIEQYDKRKWSTKWRDQIEHAYNPGFYELPKIKNFKEEMIKIFESDIEKLKQGNLVMGNITSGDEYYDIRASFDKSISSGKYDCHVNNIGMMNFNPFEELQNFINKKNNKIKDYKKRTINCFLLIYVPDTGIGNYCTFTDDILKIKFISNFDKVFLYNEGNKTVYILNTL